MKKIFENIVYVIVLIGFILYYTIPWVILILAVSCIKSDFA